MSFAASKARITKGIKSGKYKKPDTTIQDGFMAASNIVAEGLLRQGERRREEEKRKLEEARELAKDQKAKEQAAVKRKRKAEALAKDLGFSEGNTGAVTYLTEQLFLYDDDSTFVQTKADSDMKLKRLKEKELPPIVEDVTSARIDKAPPLRLDDGVGGIKTILDNGRERPLTTLDLQELADGSTARIDSKTGEKIVQPELMSEAQQMMGAFGPQQLEKSEVTQAETKQFGIEVDPKAFELDKEKMTNLADAEAYKKELEAKNLIPEDSAQLKEITARIELLKGQDTEADLDEATKDPAVAKSMLDRLDAEIEIAATDDAKKAIRESRQYKLLTQMVGQNVDKIPFQDLTTVAAIQAYRRSIAANRLNISPEGKTALDIQEGQLRANESRAFIENITSLETAEAELNKLRATGTYTQRLLAEKIVAGFQADATKASNKDLLESLLNPESLIGLTSVELAERKATATQLGAKVEDLNIINARLNTRRILEGDAKFAEYVKNSITYDRTLGQIQVATQNNESQEIIDGLTELAERQKKQTEKEAQISAGVYGTETFAGVLIDPKTKDQSFVQVVKDADGNLTLTGGNTPVDTANFRKMSEPELEQFNKISAQQQKYIKELSASGVSLAEALRNSELAIDIATNSPMVRNAGGSFAQFITSTVRGTSNIIDVTANLFQNATEGVDETGAAVTYITEDQLLSALQQQGVGKNILDAIVSKDVQNLADETAKFQASMVILAFRSGRIEGQSGNAMSNKDFERLTQMLNTSGSVQAFADNLRGYMRSKVESYDDAVFQAEDTGLVADFKERFQWSPVASLKDFQTFVTERDSATLTKAFDNTMTGGFPEPNAKAIEALKNNPDKAADFDGLFGKGAAAKILGNN
jgi:hypothetical protein